MKKKKRFCIIEAIAMLTVLPMQSAWSFGKKAAEEKPIYISLKFDGEFRKTKTEVMGTFAVRGKEYIVLAPVKPSEDIYIYGYRVISPDEFELLNINDEREFDRVVEELDRLLAEE